jgi:hypothetical protein
MVPVITPHTGCVTETVGVDGTGLALMVALVPDEVHPPELLAETVYVLMARLEKIPVVLVYVEPSML